MNSYEALAASYDELTEDVEYEKRADFVEKLFLRAKRPVFPAGRFFAKFGPLSVQSSPARV
mgnify:FL=1